MVALPALDSPPHTHTVNQLSLSLVVWHVKQYSTSIKVAYRWVKTESLSRIANKGNLATFLCHGGKCGAFLGDYWCKILIYSFLNLPLCMLRHVNIFPLQPTPFPLSFYYYYFQCLSSKDYFVEDIGRYSSFPVQEFATLQDRVTGLFASKKMLIRNIENPQVPSFCALSGFSMLLGTSCAEV